PRRDRRVRAGRSAVSRNGAAGFSERRRCAARAGSRRARIEGTVGRRSRRARSSRAGTAAVSAGGRELSRTAKRSAPIRADTCCSGAGPGDALRRHGRAVPGARRRLVAARDCECRTYRYENELESFNKIVVPAEGAQRRSLHDTGFPAPTKALEARLFAGITE